MQKNWRGYPGFLDLICVEELHRTKGHDLVYRVWDYDEAGKGSTDGLECWKTKAEFSKAFDFDEEAERASP